MSSTRVKQTIKNANKSKITPAIKFMNEFIAPVWCLDLSKPQDVKVANRILINSILNN
jgi:hypothetical protein